MTSQHTADGETQIEELAADGSGELLLVPDLRVVAFVPLLGQDDLVTRLALPVLDVDNQTAQLVSDEKVLSFRHIQS